jgi:drug/metabolite transporter (DMT)-like permease
VRKKILSKQSGNWVLFIVLSITWGSSFILMKLGLEELTDLQVASLRIVAAGLVLLPVTVRHIRSIPSNRLGMVFLSGVLGSLLPAYLFCIAETKIDSALAGTLNALTPIFAIIAGFFIFKLPLESKKINGILVAFAGCILLMFSKGIKGEAHIGYSLIVVLATVSYGINANLVKKYLHGIGSLKTVAIGLSLCAVPALLVLIFTGYFNRISDAVILKSTVASVVLGVVGSAIANVFYYMLIKRAGVLFSSMVTYGIPVVAIFWGIVAKEDIGWKQIVSLFVILAGVYMANRSVKTVVAPD